MMRRRRAVSSSKSSDRGWTSSRSITVAMTRPPSAPEFLRLLADLVVGEIALVVLRAAISETLAVLQVVAEIPGRLPILFVEFAGDPENRLQFPSGHDRPQVPVAASGRKITASICPSRQG